MTYTINPEKYVNKIIGILIALILIMIIINIKNYKLQEEQEKQEIESERLNIKEGVLEGIIIGMEKAIDITNNNELPYTKEQLEIIVNQTVDNIIKQ